MADKPKKKWIQSAVKPENRGKFKAKAEAAGKTTKEFAAEHAGDKGTLGKEARFANNVMGMSRKPSDRQKRLYSRSQKD